MNSAFGLVQLSKLPKLAQIRKVNIDRYVQNLKKHKTSFVLPARYEEYDWLAFPLMHKDRRGLLRYLEENGVQTRVTFSGNITRHPAYRHYLDETSYPEADRIMAEGLLLGAHHGLTFDDIDRVCDLLVAYDTGKVDTAAFKAKADELERAEQTKGKDACDL